MEREERRKEKGLKEKYYDKNKVKISQLHVKKKSQMPKEKRTHVSRNSGCRSRAATATAKTSSTERVRKLRQKKSQKKRKKNEENGLARKDLRDIVTRNKLAYLKDNL